MYHFEEYVEYEKSQVVLLVEHLSRTLPTTISVKGELIEKDREFEDGYDIGDISIDTFQDNTLPKGIRGYSVYGSDNELIGLYWMWDIPKGSTIIFKRVGEYLCSRRGWNDRLNAAIEDFKADKE